MDKPKPDQNSDIADASLLFGEPSPTARPTPAKPKTPAPDDAYAVEGPDTEPESEPVPIPIPAAPPRARTRSRSDESPSRREGEKTKSKAASSGVEELWTRGAEWGGSLIRLGIGLIVVGFLLVSTFRADALFLWVMLFLASVVGLIVLAYPIFITFERPVRITPEHAVKDYFGAFSHLVPHTKRMWLLLATDGRSSPEFQSYGAFQAYWKRQVAAWKTDSKSSGPLNPFDIEVQSFKSEKSVGETLLEATYTARVIKRGEPSEVVATYNIATRVVRGEDKMWYLDSGTLS